MIKADQGDKFNLGHEALRQGKVYCKEYSFYNPSSLLNGNEFSFAILG